jgi:acyl dehydratase
MAESFEITDEMRSVVGVESEPWTYEVTTTSVRAFARGVGYTDPVYFDEEAGRGAGYRSLPAPPTYLGTPVFIPGKSNDTFSGPRAGGPALNHGLPGLLDGGTETVYERPIVAGDVLSVTSKLADLETKTSRALGTMLVTTNETTFRDAGTGEVVARQRAQAIFY